MLIKEYNQSIRQKDMERANILYVRKKKINKLVY